METWELLAMLAAVALSGYTVGWVAGWSKAERIWKSRVRENRRLVIDTMARLAEAERREHERYPLTADEHERFLEITEMGDDT